MHNKCMGLYGNLAKTKASTYLRCIDEDTDSPSYHTTVSDTKMTERDVLWDFLCARLKFSSPTRKIFRRFRIVHWDLCTSNNIKYNNNNKKYWVKQGLSRNHRMLFCFHKSTGISKEIRWIVFKKLIFEILCDITKIPKEKQNMCPQELAAF